MPKNFNFLFKPSFNLRILTSFPSDSEKETCAFGGRLKPQKINNLAY
jgi:hypothetical protein